MSMKITITSLALWVMGTLLVPSAAWAATWGEIAFQVSSGSDVARVVGFYDNVVQDLEHFRFLTKQGANPWDESSPEATGWSMAAHQALVADAKTSQAAFDAEANGLLGSWYAGKSATLQAMLRDATRRASNARFVIRLEGAGHSGPATIADYDVMAAAAAAGDRAAFDTAAINAWGSWYFELAPADADLVYQIVIDHIEAG